MHRHSQAYKKLKLQVQDNLDFAILCSQAIPSMNAYMKAVDNGAADKLPEADHFNKGEQDFSRLKKIIPKYKKQLGKMLVLSYFSYFEAYIKEIISELFEYHGGFETFKETALKKHYLHLNCIESDSKYANQLRRQQKKHQISKYEKNTAILEAAKFKFPSELFSVFGLIELEKNYSNLKASEIPHVLQWCFGIPLSTSEVELFNKYREVRNNIAHGKLNSFDLKKAFDVGDFFRSLAIKTDEHIMKHFFLIEL